MVVNNKDTSSALSLDLKSLTELANHVVLPPRLPQSEDATLASTDDNLLRLSLEVATRYISSLDENVQASWRPVATMLSDWIEIKQGTALNDKALNAKLANLRLLGKSLYDSYLTLLRTF